MRVATILLTIFMLISLGLFTSAASNISGKLANRWAGTPNFLPHLVKAAALTPTPTGNPADLPDLEPYSYHHIYQDPCPWGSPGTGWASVLNSGPADAGPFTIFFNGSRFPVPRLAARATVEVSRSFDSGPVAYVLVIADSEEEIVEGDEQDNRFELFYTPPPPCTPMGTAAP